MSDVTGGWKVRRPDHGQTDWESVPAEWVLSECHHIVATEWWDQTFTTRDCEEDGILEVTSPAGVVKKFEMGVEAIPHAYAEEIYETSGWKGR